MEMLNYVGVHAHNEAYFGEGSGSIHLDEVACDGSEKRLLDCTMETRQHDCRHSEDAGVSECRYVTRIVGEVAELRNGFAAFELISINIFLHPSVHG